MSGLPQRTLISATRSVPYEVPTGWELREVTDADVSEISALYLNSYDPGLACATLDEAELDIVASFRGDYGRLLPEGSLVLRENGALKGCVLTVEHGLWEKTPSCPFIIELFVARGDRQKGLGRLLTSAVLTKLNAAGLGEVALRVLGTNRAALALYEGLGFRDWNPSQPRS